MVTDHGTRLAFVAGKWSSKNRTNWTGGTATDHARACKCHGTLVVPEWPSAIFWPMLSKSKGVFAEFVVGSMHLSLSKGRRGATLFKGDMPNTNVLALRIEFK